ncbi:hypothetical protein DM860_006465 [Cuscuta australis]|uniref:Uncharacterized protein n=1 Tax=Cuscuta australis TaxID=267555 RepID=A0A328D3V6_9ASTE|nr:hypothetical protein DM860_006465 [Cuscuta australis]
MKKPWPGAVTTRGQQHTSPMVWCLAIFCTVVTVAVILAGIVVFVGYMVARPKVPQMIVERARIEELSYDMVGHLSLRISVVIKAENDNAKARAYFYHTSFGLSFHGVRVAYLNAAPFAVARNSTRELDYLVESSPIPLTPEEGERVAEGLKGSAVMFELKGTTRTRWSIWVVGSVKFWMRLDCRLKLPVNGTAVYPNCATKAR